MWVKRCWVWMEQNFLVWLGLWVEKEFSGLSWVQSNQCRTLPRMCETSNLFCKNNNTDNKLLITKWLEKQFDKLEKYLQKSIFFLLLYIKIINGLFFLGLVISACANLHITLEIMIKLSCSYDFAKYIKKLTYERIKMNKSKPFFKYR